MTVPTYDPNIPQFNSDQLAITQPQLLRNFQTLFSFFNKNHVHLDEVNAGNHTFIELIQQLHPIQTNVSEISIYTKNVEDTTAQVFFRYQGNGQEFQFTNYQIYELSQNEKLRTQYFVTLPGNFIVYFGKFFTTATTFTLELSPGIAKHIASISTCPFRTTVPTIKINKASVELPKKNSDGFFDQIIFKGSLSVRDSYYLILANI